MAVFSAEFLSEPNGPVAIVGEMNRDPTGKINYKRSN